MSLEFDDQVALVTGGGSGIGRASALALSRSGASVAVADRDASAAQDTANAIVELGGRSVAVGADTAEIEGAEAMVQAAVQEFGQLNHVHANAAVEWFGNVVECEIDEWDRMFAVNLRGVFVLAKRAIPEQIHAGGGSFVATCSDCSIRTSPRTAGYTASKAGLVGLVRSIAVDFGAQGIRANLVSPGVTDTPGLHRIYAMNGGDVEERIERAAALSPLGRIGTPEEVAEVVAFLCSDRARYMTGAHVSVDGGMTVTYGAD